MIEAVLSSFALPGIGMEDCRVIIACDGFVVRDEVQSSNKRGRVTPDGKERYEEYVSTLRALVGRRRPFLTCELLELKEHHGFGHAVRAALRVVETPFTCVAQHDWSFMRSPRGATLADVIQAGS